MAPAEPADRVPEPLITIEPSFQVVCRFCGPLECVVYAEAERALRDGIAHARSHAAGLYLEQEMARMTREEGC
jgi:hypothetical protein